MANIEILRNYCSRRPIAICSPQNSRPQFAHTRLTVLKQPGRPLWWLPQRSEQIQNIYLL